MHDTRKKKKKGSSLNSKPIKPRPNDLDGATWTKFSISIWDVVKTHQENKLKHPAMFPLELCRRLIRIYTKEGETVLDPFVGSGSTIIAAKEMSRRGIGIDVNPDFVRLAKRRTSQDTLITPKEGGIFVYQDDAINLSKYIPSETIDLCITSPPYWNIMLRKRTADYKESRPYSDLKSDLGNMPDYETFMQELKIRFEKVYGALKPNKKCIVIVMDIRQGSQFIPFHIGICHMMEEIGFKLNDIIIWDRRKEYNSLRPLGYPYVFIVNKVHEYILIFGKNNSGDCNASN